MDEFLKKLEQFLSIENDDLNKAKKKEKIQVNINPDSYIGREIRYQTVILKEIIEQNDKIIRILRTRG